MDNNSFETEGCQTNMFFVLSKYICEGKRNSEPKSISRVSIKKTTKQVGFTILPIVSW